MDRMIVSNLTAEKLRRFPNEVCVDSEQGTTLARIQRIDPSDELPKEQLLTTAEIEQTLREIFVNS